MKPTGGDTAVDVPVDFPDIPPSPRPAEYQRLAREISALTGDHLESLGVALLASSTLDLLRPIMVVEGARARWRVDLLVGAYGQLEQLVMDPTGPLYEAPPDILVLAFQPSDVAPDVFDRYYATDGRGLDTVCEDLTGRLIDAARTFRDRAGRPVLVANFATPAALPLGPFDADDPNGLTHRLAAHNVRLAQRARGTSGVHVWDYAGLVRECGAASWSDSRLQLMARMTVGSEHLPAMARHLLRTITALRRPTAKCLVLDLDNTLWGGVVGDDGIEGLELGDDWPGSAYKAFQRAVLGLRDRGILLALASKNDESVATNALRTHPEMLIGWDDLAAVRINWDPKSESMRSIAEELNIGVDALVLFDDNPVERAEVRASLPQAAVIEVPSDPTGYRDALLSSGYFDQSRLSDEDRDRAEMYRVERRRALLRQNVSSLDDFLHGLQMEAVVGLADVETLGRIAQLVGKTNQFNLTTRRHSQSELARMAEGDDTVVAWLRLKDRFGDQGLVAVGIVERRDQDAWVDTFLMSCRVMNRGVEQAMLSYLAEHAAAAGCKRLVGEYRPTAKNHIVERFFPDLGFEPHGADDKATLWKLDLGEGEVTWPGHIQRITATDQRKGGRPTV